MGAGKWNSLPARDKRKGDERGLAVVSWVSSL
jgi:hypothetical protein